MSEKLKIDRPVLVEGKYDKIKLSSIIDAEIFTTDGFGIFKSEQKKQMLRRISEKKGLIILTDSDGGGLVIRGHLRGILPKDNVTHIYIPKIKGREKRKTEDSKEGLLGVEGIDTDILRKLLSPFVISDSGQDEKKEKSRNITVTDLYDDGLCGKENSSEKRKALCKKAGLPDNISTSALVEVLNVLYSYEEYRSLL